MRKRTLNPAYATLSAAPVKYCTVLYFLSSSMSSKRVSYSRMVVVTARPQGEPGSRVGKGKGEKTDSSTGTVRWA